MRVYNLALSGLEIFLQLSVFPAVNPLKSLIAFLSGHHSQKPRIETDHLKKGDFVRPLFLLSGSLWDHYRGEEWVGRKTLLHWTGNRRKHTSWVTGGGGGGGEVI